MSEYNFNPSYPSHMVFYDDKTGDVQVIKDGERVLNLSYRRHYGVSPSVPSPSTEDITTVERAREAIIEYEENEISRRKNLISKSRKLIRKIKNSKSPRFLDCWQATDFSYHKTTATQQDIINSKYLFSSEEDAKNKVISNLKRKIEELSK